ncbi:major facilitator superfamily domain-containing protein [Mycena maculata]|uniref:Major facilitator superfamily domain-containing protein n=1 Tax=Mycena maculata TaxID=230809 RepID=A0AAD7NKA3_9AGAR|nr:major facilitator superfamily domain-containing protein [Mycena maculata]
MSANETHDVDTLNDSQTHSNPEKPVYEVEVQPQPQDSPAEEDDYPHGVKLALLTLALCLSVFLVALDNTIIATAIPKITDQFHSLDDVGWYGSAYLLTTAATQLLFGKFYTFLPIKWVYVAAITVFEIGSLLCGVAPNSDALIVGRAIAGLGSAGIFSGAMIIVANTVPLTKRPMYTGLIGGMFGIASVAGPLMGGVFTDKVTWRWCFYINLPIGAVTLAVVVFLFKMPRRGQVKAQSATFAERVALFDPWGTLVFIPAIVCLLLALQWGGSKYPWKSGRIIALFVVFGVLIGIFIGIQLWKQDRATIPPRILKKRSIWSSALYAFCIGSAFFILSFYLPIWFQAIHGVSAVHSGIDNLPMILSLVLASLISGALITVLGYYAPFMILSSVVAAVGTGLISTLKTNSSHTKWMPYEIVCGLGVGFGMQQPMLAAQAVLELKDVPIGTSIIMFSQTLGGALFISIAQNVFTNKLVSGLVKSVPDVSPALVLSAGATSLKDAVAPQFLEAVLFVYNEALVAAFYVAIAMACLSLVGSLIVEWRNIKGKNVEMAMGA